MVTVFAAWRGGGTCFGQRNARDITNLENGLITGSNLGVYAQFPPDVFASPADFGTGTFSNFTITALGGGVGITGDYNDSGQVEQGDLDLVLQNWGDDTGVTGIPAGWTNDNTNLGQIEQTELDRVLQNWGSTIAPDFAGRAVPEPATLALLGLGGLALLRRRVE